MSDRRLKVAVDARCLNVEHLRGMGKSLFELVKRTASSGAVEWHLLADCPDRPMRLPEVQGCHASVFETRGYRFQAWEQWSLPRRAQRLGVDLLHAPATTMPWWQPVPSVVTIHDVIPWQNQDTAKPAGFYRERLLPSAYARASAVITVSNTSRRDIVNRWPQLDDKLHVVSPGVDDQYFKAAPDQGPISVGEQTINGPYLLYLGGADPRKRLSWAIQTWQGCASMTEVWLVVCGLEPNAEAAVRETVPRSLQDRLIVAPFISEQEMPNLYLRAAAVLYPSTYEGFGLPAVEAQAVGTPVLFSDVGSLTELKGPGAVVLPVDDLSEWIRAAMDLLRAHGTRSDSARQWASRYSWDRYVDQTMAVYNLVSARADS